ncbi:MAG: 1-deoxy-D-xylulose-5-phosphate reductoisomerase [Phycisphaeraceae bacterium]|nr:1-deoxy-D-xylulose-5-phosphate reductoisomerase [Phycisphaeraceae bacterium]
MSSPMARPDVTPTRRLIILGSTGSIGVNTLDVVAHLNATREQRQAAGLSGRHDGYVQVVGLAAGRNVRKLVEQARAFAVTTVAVADAQAAEAVRQALPDVRVFAGEDAALKLVEQVPCDEIIAAVVGSAGLPATLRAAEQGKLIGLANKETLVAAGALVTPTVRRCNARLLPVDSEHSAIFQCLEGQPRQAVKRIVLTASGGPFRKATKQQMDNATVDEALNHPTWRMGPKITIDSATMMNKALEIIEAHWLFDLPATKIDVIIHPQSIAHSFVEFEDNSILAQMGPPDMRTPIQYALTYPDRPVGCSRAMDWSKLGTLEFEPPDHDRFGALKLAYDVIEAGGTAGAVFNGANEAAVAAFLAGRIRFGRIVQLAAEALSAIPARPVDSLAAALDADRQARAYVESAVGR